MDQNFRRLVDTLSAISPNRKVSTTEILDRLKARGHYVTARTLQRDLDALAREFGLERDDKSKPFGWRWPEKAVRVSVPEMDWPEALSFYLVRENLHGLMPSSVRDHLSPHFLQAERRLKQHFHDVPLKRWPEKIRVVPTGMPLTSPNVSRAVRDAVTEALLLDRQLEIQYRRRDQKDPQKRVIHPLGLVQFGQVFYLAARFPEYEDVRSLALHRIARASMLPARAERPEGFTLDRWLEEGAMGFGGRGSIRVDLEFSHGAGEHLVESPLASDQQVDRVDGDESRLRLRATVLDTQRLRWWLLGFAERVQVLQPASLRKDIASRLRAAAQAYRSVERRNK